MQTQVVFKLTARHPLADPILTPIDTLSFGMVIDPTHHDSNPDSNLTGRRLQGDQLVVQQRSRPTAQAHSRDLMASDQFQSYRASVESPDGERSGARQITSQVNLLDGRLQALRIGYWTRVSVSDSLAAKVISAYLEVHQLFLGLFDADLFLRDLIDCRLDFCSSFLVSSLLFYACVSAATLCI